MNFTRLLFLLLLAAYSQLIIADIQFLQAATVQEKAGDGRSAFHIEAIGSEAENPDLRRTDSRGWIRKFCGGSEQ